MKSRTSPAFQRGTYRAQSATSPIPYPGHVSQSPSRSTSAPPAPLREGGTFYALAPFAVALCLVGAVRLLCSIVQALLEGGL